MKFKTYLKKLIPNSDRKTVSVLRLSGIIRHGRGLCDETLGPAIKKAFAKKPDAVALVVNSPGGSPVQSSLIAARIRRLADEKNIPVYAFVEDVAASGGYWLAAAADHIYVDHTSIVGSIGVISSGFGFDELIARYGISRRVHTAGKSKSMLDPFQPQKAQDVKRLKAMLGDVHERFKEYITERRKDKLSKRDLFTGEIWVGQKAIKEGLADDIGHMEPILKSILGDKTRFKTYGPKRGLSSRLGMMMFENGFHSLEERIDFARFGL